MGVNSFTNGMSIFLIEIVHLVDFFDFNLTINQIGNPSENQDKENMLVDGSKIENKLVRIFVVVFIIST
jgi:hypothetical protein